MASDRFAYLKSNSRNGSKKPWSISCHNCVGIQIA
ncbi:hypothetical protein EVC45_33510 [Paraburkholderia sp. UYCP14C]|nr:hypothetical protein EVC45_33510 [Paraburkholderia sp. UYCP14C]